MFIYFAPLNFNAFAAKKNMERAAEWWEMIFLGDVGGCCDGRDGIPVSFFIL
jgi:hypothetical protein